MPDGIPSLLRSGCRNPPPPLSASSCLNPKIGRNAKESEGVAHDTCLFTVRIRRLAGYCCACVLVCVYRLVTQSFPFQFLESGVSGKSRASKWSGEKQMCRKVRCSFTVHGFRGSRVQVGLFVVRLHPLVGGRACATNNNQKNKKGVVDEPIQRVRRAISLSCYDDCQKP